MVRVKETQIDRDREGQKEKAREIWMEIEREMVI